MLTRRSQQRDKIHIIDGPESEFFRFIDHMRKNFSYLPYRRAAGYTPGVEMNSLTFHSPTPRHEVLQFSRELGGEDW